ncbi:MAG: MFS transporter, partial [Patescibacteria group bacterium]|nr:MFS transporter [Patescibacteria group bacterium]
MTRNIYLAYFLAAMKHTWFFLGVWVLYYLKFTDYAGIGLIETVLIVTTSIGEIPTGAVADLLGKKKTLIIAFALEAIGGFLMAFAQNFHQLIFSVFTMCLGGAMYSGTLDALVFDSLKQDKQESKYDQIIANIATISLVTIALVSIIGGWLYSINPRLPFFANAAAYVFGIIASFFLIEPVIDTIKFSARNYFIQTKKGFDQLFSKLNHRLVFKLLLIGGKLVILDEMMEAFLLVEYGFKDQAMGIIYSLIYILSAFSSQLTPWLKRKLGLNFTLIFIGLILAISLTISPFIGLIFGGLMVILRYNLAPIFSNLTSVIINQHTESKYRATTISTFNMIKNL